MTDELFQALLSEMQELRLTLNKTNDKIVGWQNFNLFKDDTNNRFGRVDERLTDHDGRLQAVERTCNEFDIRKEDLIRNNELLQGLNDKLALFNFSWCTARFLFTTKQGAIITAILLFIFLSLAINDWNTTIGRLSDAGHVNISKYPFP